MSAALQDGFLTTGPSGKFQKFQSFNYMIGSFDDQLPDSHTCKSHLIRKATPLASEILRFLGALCQKPGIKTKYYNHPCNSENYKGFRSSMPGIVGRDQIYISYYITDGANT